MSETLIDEQIRDTNTYSAKDPIRNFSGKTLYQFDNTLDQSVTVIIEGTYAEDTDFSESVELANFSIGSGSSDAQTLTDPWHRIKIKVSAGTSPTSGRFLTEKMKSPNN